MKAGKLKFNLQQSKILGYILNILSKLFKKSEIMYLDKIPKLFIIKKLFTTIHRLQFSSTYLYLNIDYKGKNSQFA